MVCYAKISKNSCLGDIIVIMPKTCRNCIITELGDTTYITLGLVINSLISGLGNCILITLKITNYFEIAGLWVVI